MLGEEEPSVFVSQQLTALESCPEKTNIVQHLEQIHLMEVVKNLKRKFCKMRNAQENSPLLIFPEMEAQRDLHLHELEKMILTNGASEKKNQK